MTSLKAAQAIFLWVCYHQVLNQSQSCCLIAVDFFRRWRRSFKRGFQSLLFGIRWLQLSSEVYEIGCRVQGPKANDFGFIFWRIFFTFWRNLFYFPFAIPLDFLHHFFPGFSILISDIYSLYWKSARFLKGHKFQGTLLGSYSP